MHDKEKLSMYVDITKITIIICWVSLIGFWLLKIFGGNFFEIMVENENFLKFSDLVQHTWVKYLYSLISMSVSNYLIFGAVLQKFVFKGKELIYVFFSVLSMWAVVNFVNVPILTMIYGYLPIIVSGFLFHSGKKKILGILAIILELLFSTISILVRNIDMVISSNYLISIIMSIDMYLMALIYYMYSNFIRLKKEI